MKLSCHPAPADALVRWADQMASVYCAADRPWFWAPPPMRPAPYWEYQCRCRRGPVRVKSFPSADRCETLYLGQCQRCETLIWTYRCIPREA